jgi:phage terminase large subunit
VIPTPPISPTPKQWEAIRAVRSAKYRYILTGGAISTAKSYGLALMFLSMARQFPQTRYGIFRKNMSVIKRTIHITFKKVARELGMVEGRDFTINRADMVWEFANGSQVWFMELDETKDPDFNKVKGLELTAAGIDEANEVVEEAFHIVSSRVGRENRNDEPQFVLLTCNPSDNWIKDKFYTPWVKDELEPPYLFIPSLPHDNPHNNAEYLAALNGMPLQFRKRYVEGNWDYVDDSSALFPNRVLDAAMRDAPGRGERFIGADIAREGSDNNVFALVEGSELNDLYIPDIEISDEAPILNQTADELIMYASRNGITKNEAWRISVDAVGLGAGVVDNCRKKGWMVTSFKSGSSSLDLDRDGKPKFDMLRSERYFKLSQAMQEGKFHIYSKSPELEELRKDLLAHTYEVTDKQFVVESKKSLKKRLRRSPDFSDAVVMAYQPEIANNGDVAVAVGNYDSWFSNVDDD